MTVSTTSAWQLTRNEIIRRAYQLAGLLEVSQQLSGDQARQGADFLSMELDSLQNRGRILRTVETGTLTLADGTATYDLPDDTMSIVIDGSQKAGMVSLSGDAETVVTGSSRQQYEALPNKDEEGRPILCFFDEGATITATFYPTPDAAYSFRYVRVRLMRDSDRGSNNIDLGKRWQKAIVYAVAWQAAMANNAPMDRVGAIRAVAEAEIGLALASETDKVSSQLILRR